MEIARHVTTLAGNLSHAVYCEIWLNVAPVPCVVRGMQTVTRRRPALPDVPEEELPSEALLAGFGAGDEQIAVAFVRRFQRSVFGIALAILGDERLAEDVAQGTFERAWRHAATYDARRASVRTWLTTIAHNLAVDVLRARVPTPVAPEELAGLLGVIRETPQRQALAEEDSAELRAGLALLPKEQARAVLLAGIYG